MGTSETLDQIHWVSTAVSARTFFAVGGRDFTGADVLVAAKKWGDISTCEVAAREWATGPQPDAGAVADEERAFRRTRKLFSADDLGAWLARWDVQVGDWRRFLRASALRKATPTDVSESVPIAQTDVPARAVWTELICSGTFANAAHRLAEVVAAADAAGVRLPAGALTSADLTALHAGEATFCAQIVAVSEVKREIEPHQLDWLWIRWRAAQFADLDVAREAFLCVAHDGRAFEEVAASAGVQATEHTSFVDDLDPAVRTALVGAGAGIVVGPLSGPDGETLLLEVLERRVPTVADPVVRERAEVSLLRRAFSSQAINNVRWHEHA